MSDKALKEEFNRRILPEGITGLVACIIISVIAYIVIAANG